MVLAYALGKTQFIIIISSSSSSSSSTIIIFKYMGQNCSVGIVTCYRLDGLGIESRWGRDFPHLSRPAHPASSTLGTKLFPGVKRPGLGDDHPPQPSAEVKESGAIPLLPLWAFVACSREKFTFCYF